MLNNHRQDLFIVMFVNDIVADKGLAAFTSAIWTGRAEDTGRLFPSVSVCFCLFLSVSFLQPVQYSFTHFSFMDVWYVWMNVRTV